MVLVAAALPSILSRPLLAAEPTASAESGAAPAGAKRPFVHPGLLHKDKDFRRMAAAVHAEKEPWLSGWNRLTANNHARLSYRPRPVEIVVRGRYAEPENYGRLFNDVAAAYACALCGGFPAIAPMGSKQSRSSMPGLRR